jgi:hypothetical protein
MIVVKTIVGVVWHEGKTKINGSGGVHVIDELIGVDTGIGIHLALIIDYRFNSLDHVFKD